MIADRAGHDHAVPGACRRDRERPACGNNADAGRRDEDAIALATVDDLGVAGHERDARLCAGLAHRVDDAREIGQLQPLLEDEGGRQEQRLRTAHGEIVDRAVHGEPPDVPAGKEDRPHDKGIGREGEAGTVDAQRCLVLQSRQHVVPERREEHAVHEVGGEPSTAAVTKHDPLVLADGDRTVAEQTRQITSSSPRIT